MEYDFQETKKKDAKRRNCIVLSACETLPTYWFEAISAKCLPLKRVILLGTFLNLFIFRQRNKQQFIFSYFTTFGFYCFKSNHMFQFMRKKTITVFCLHDAYCILLIAHCTYTFHTNIIRMCSFNFWRSVIVFFKKWMILLDDVRLILSTYSNIYLWMEQKKDHRMFRADSMRLEIK